MKITTIFYLTALTLVYAFTDRAPGDWNHKYATLKSGLEMHYVEAGNPANPTVILLHGWPDFWYTWRHQIPALAQNFHVIAPDQRGYGNTDVPSSIPDYHIEFLTKDVVELIEFLGKDKVHLIGHDWGAVITWSAAFLFPEKFHSVAGLSVPYMVPHGTIELFERKFSEDFYIVKFQQIGYAEQYLKNFEAFFRAVFLAPKQPPKPKGKQEIPTVSMFAFGIAAATQHPSVFAPTKLFTQQDLEYYARTFRKTGLFGSLAYYRNWNRNVAFLTEKALSRNTSYTIGIPSLHVSATNDLEFLHNPAYVNSPYLSDYSVVTVNAGHFMHQENVEEVNKVLLEFLEKGRTGKQETKQEL